MGERKEPTMEQWCWRNACGLFSIAAEGERARRRRRDAQLAQMRARLDEAERRANEGPAPSRPAVVSTPAPSTRSTPTTATRVTPRRVISTKVVRYGGNDVKETILDVGGLRFCVRECAAWSQPRQVERIGG